MVEKLSAKIDTLLEPLLLSTRPEHADEIISRLITDHAEPVIRRVIRYKLHLSADHPAQRDDVDDIYQETVFQLLSEFRQLRNEPDAHSIADVRGLTAVIAHRTCSRWMRHQFPERNAFKNRIYYLLTRQRGFAVWRDNNEKLIAGFDASKGQKHTATADQLSKLAEEGTLLAQIGSSSQSEALADALATIFDRAGPVEFDRLTSFLAELLQIRDQPLDSVDQNEVTIWSAVSAREPGTDWQVEKRIFLQRLWEELQQLPLNQRAALLLNLKDEEGRGCIALFSVTGIASLRQLAAVLEIGPHKFAELWNELPIDDARIAEMLGLKRQQVINARKAGRERLVRRLRGFI